MLLSHAQTLAQARSHIAALADQALSVEASSAYERVLLDLDRIHDDECPALDSAVLGDDRDILLSTASAAIEHLGTYGVDALSLELLLAKLIDARDLDIG